MEENQKIIEFLYKINYFPGLTKLKKIVKKANPDISDKEVVEFYNNEITTQLTKKQDKKVEQGHMIAYFVNEIWLLDIVDLVKYNLFNKGYKYLLLAVDVFSRKVFTTPLKGKDIPNVLQGFRELIKHEKPRTILSDHEPAFIGNEFYEYLKKKEIVLNVNKLGDHHALGILDNFVKKLKTILTKLFLKNNSTNWIDSIKSIIAHHNKSDHTALKGVSPNDATTKDDYQKVLNINIEKNLKNKIVSDLEIGDKVRKDLLYNDKFAKRTETRWSGKVYKVVKVINRTIHLDDGSIMKRENLLKAPETAKDYEDPIAENKRINKELN
jgi:hypothetical protein